MTLIDADVAISTDGSIAAPTAGGTVPIFAGQAVLGVKGISFARDARTRSYGKRW